MQMSNFSDGSPGFAMVGRVLLALTMTLVVLMPWSESFWHFDHFLQGGQDFEMGLLALAALLCLVLVLVEHRSQGVGLLLAMQRWLSLVAEMSRAVAGWTSFQVEAWGVRCRAARGWRDPGLNSLFAPLRI